MKRKKTERRLLLSKVTISNLNDTEMASQRGGHIYTLPATCEPTVRPWCLTDEPGCTITNDTSCTSFYPLCTTKEEDCTA